MSAANFHRLSFRFLFFIGVHDVGKEPTLAVLVLGLLLVLLNGALIHAVAEVEHIAARRGLPGIDVSNENHIQMPSRIRLLQAAFGFDWLGLLFLYYLLLLLSFCWLLHFCWSLRLLRLRCRLWCFRCRLWGSWLGLSCGCWRWFWCRGLFCLDLSFFLRLCLPVILCFLSWRRRRALLFLHHCWLRLRRWGPSCSLLFKRLCRSCCALLGLLLLLLLLLRLLLLLHGLILFEGHFGAASAAALAAGAPSATARVASATLSTAASASATSTSGGFSSCARGDCEKALAAKGVGYLGGRSYICTSTRLGFSSIGIRSLA
mmetsp:Transcript_69598/g.166984  ORF Transcript_69598/g.166984 Transcript_69598/m.166984 type:complete len:318 (-) Transcript_69598:731-1684(-)